MKKAYVQPYLFFGGRCEEAVHFYRDAIGAEIVAIMRFKESPEPPPPGMVPPGHEDKVMHCAFRIGDSLIMCSDGCDESSVFSGFSLAITFPCVAEVDRAFASLSEGGQVQMLLGTTFWSPRFGMVKDRFGTGWMVSADEQPPAQKE